MTELRVRRAVAVYTLVGLLSVAPVLATEMWVWLNLWPLQVRWGVALLWSLPLLLIWSLLLPVAANAVLRWPIEGVNRHAHLILHVGTSMAFAFASLVLLDQSDELLGWSTWMGAPGTLVADIRKTVIHLHLGIALYWVLLGAMHAAFFKRLARQRALQTARLETHLVRSRLDALKTQLQPHFLFNALNSIAVLVRKDPETAERTLHQLSDFLRAVLDRSDESVVSLAEELELANQYLALEKVRFRDRLQVELRIDEHVKMATVPNLLLQPLVENAVRHGISPQRSGGVVAICAQRENGQLVLSVRDSGPGIRDANSAHLNQGVGLRNTKRRLETMYGSRQQFTTRNLTGGGFEVRITIPFQRPDEMSSEAGAET